MREASDYPILKVKMGSDDDREVLTAVRDTTDRPIRVDANEGWTPRGALPGWSGCTPSGSSSSSSRCPRR